MRENALLYITFAFLLVISIAFFELGYSSGNSNSTDRTNGLSYILGLKIGKNLEANDIKINMTMFLRGLEDGRQGASPILTDKQVSQASDIVMMIMQCQAAAKRTDLETYDEFMINDVMRYKQTNYKGILNY